MIKLLENKSQNGSIGIGAMIIFIALILVAAVSSTVIIETIENLQQSGEKTGSDVSLTVNTKPIPTSLRIIGDGDGATFCATEGGDCEFIGMRYIRYVSNDDSSKFFELELSDGTPCTNDVFGDPDVGKLKSCFIIESKELLLTWQMTAGSLNTQAQNINYIVFCNNDGSLQSDSDDMVSAQMRFIDGTNYAGDEGAFVTDDLIEVGSKYRVILRLVSCIPSIEEEMTLMIYAIGGGESTITMYFGTIDIGYKVY